MTDNQSIAWQKAGRCPISLLYKSRLNTCMYPNRFFRVQTSPLYGWNTAFPGGLVKKTSHRVDPFVQTRFVQNDGRHAILRCTLQQCSRMMPSGPDSLYAPPAKPSYRPCFKDERAEKTLGDRSPCTLPKRTDTDCKGFPLGTVMRRLRAAFSGSPGSETALTENSLG